MKETFKKGVTEFFAVAGSSLAVGLCAVLVQGWFAFGGGDSSEDRLGMSILTATLGGEVAIVLGPILYYALLRKRLTWRLSLSGILVCLFVGASAAWSLAAITRIGGWLSMFITPMAAILFSIFVRVSKAPRTATLQEVNR